MATNLYTVSEIAERFRCSPKTVYRAIRSGRLGALRVGGRYLVGEAEVEAWAEASRVRADLVEPMVAAPAGPVEVGSLEALRRIERAA